MYCVKCGALSEDRARYCMRCGAPLVSAEPTPRRADKSQTDAPRRRKTDWHVWRRQLVGPQGLAAVVCLLLAAGLQQAKPYLLSKPASPFAATAAERQQIDAVITSRFEPISADKTLIPIPLEQLKAGADLNGTIIRVTGQLARHSVDPRGNRLLVLGDGKSEAVAVYSGFLGNVFLGDATEVDGRWVRALRAIDGSSVRGLAWRSLPREDSVVHGSMALVAYGASAAVLVMAFLIFLVRWLRYARDLKGSPTPARAKVIAGFLLAILAIVAAGCKVDQVIQVNSDGTGRLVTTFQLDVPQMNQLRDSPNANAYLTGYKENLEATGANFYNYSQGDIEYIVVERPFASLEELNSWGSNLSVRLAKSDRDFVYEYSATADRRKLYPDPAGQGASQISSQLDSMEWTYRVTLPGTTVVASPPPKSLPGGATTGEVAWSVPSKTPLDVRYVSQVVDQATTQTAEEDLKLAIATEERLIDSVVFSSVLATAIIALSLLLFRPLRSEAVDR